MATIIRRPNKRFWVQFRAPNKKRQTLRFADAKETTVRQIARAVETLQDDPNHTDSIRWLSSEHPDVLEKLTRCGLVAAQEATTLGPFLDGYIESRHDLKQSTVIQLEFVRDHLLEFFGREKNIHDITPGDADAWRLFLRKKGMVENTIRRRIGRARQFFKAAMRKKLIFENPFADLAAAVQANKDLFHHG